MLSIKQYGKKRTDSLSETLFECSLPDSSKENHMPENYAYNTIEGIKACVFDAYGTLFDVHSTVAQHWHRIGSSGGFNLQSCFNPNNSLASDGFATSYPI